MGTQALARKVAPCWDGLASADLQRRRPPPGRGSQRGARAGYTSRTGASPRRACPAPGPRLRLGYWSDDDHGGGHGLSSPFPIRRLHMPSKRPYTIGGGSFGRPKMEPSAESMRGSLAGDLEGRFFVNHRSRVRIPEAPRSAAKSLLRVLPSRRARTASLRMLDGHVEGHVRGVAALIRRRIDGIGRLTTPRPTTSSSSGRWRLPRCPGSPGRSSRPTSPQVTRWRLPLPRPDGPRPRRPGCRRQSR